MPKREAFETPEKRNLKHWNWHLSFMKWTPGSRTGEYTAVFGNLRVQTEFQKKVMALLLVELRPYPSKTRSLVYIIAKAFHSQFPVDFCPRTNRDLDRSCNLSTNPDRRLESQKESHLLTNDQAQLCDCPTIHSRKIFCHRHHIWKRTRHFKLGFKGNAVYW